MNIFSSHAFYTFCVNLNVTSLETNVVFARIILALEDGQGNCFVVVVVVEMFSGSSALASSFLTLSTLFLLNPRLRTDACLSLIAKGFRRTADVSQMMTMAVKKARTGGRGIGEGRGGGMRGVG